MVNGPYQHPLAALEGQMLVDIDRIERQLAEKIKKTNFWVSLGCVHPSKIVKLIDECMYELRRGCPHAEHLRSNGFPRVAQRLYSLLNHLCATKVEAEKKSKEYDNQMQMFFGAWLTAHSSPHLPQNNSSMTDTIRSANEYRQQVFERSCDKFDDYIRG